MKELQMIKLYIKKSPLIASNIEQLNARYDLLTRRRSSLIHEMSEHPATSRQLRALHKNELKVIRKHLSAIEDFLQSYGLINQKGSFR